MRDAIRSLKSTEPAVKPATPTTLPLVTPPNTSGDVLAERLHGVHRALVRARTGERHLDHGELAVTAHVDRDRLLELVRLARDLAHLLHRLADLSRVEVAALDHYVRAEGLAREGGLHAVVGLHDLERARQAVDAESAVWMWSTGIASATSTEPATSADTSGRRSTRSSTQPQARPRRCAAPAA